LKTGYLLSRSAIEDGVDIVQTGRDQSGSYCGGRTVI